jgi:hypothetical protein
LGAGPVMPWTLFAHALEAEKYHVKSVKGSPLVTLGLQQVRLASCGYRFSKLGQLTTAWNSGLTCNKLNCFLEACSLTHPSLSPHPLLSQQQHLQPACWPRPDLYGKPRYQGFDRLRTNKPTCALRQGTKQLACLLVNIARLWKIRRAAFQRTSRPSPHHPLDTRTSPADAHPTTTRQGRRQKTFLQGAPPGLSTSAWTGLSRMDPHCADSGAFG